MKNYRKHIDDFFREKLGSYTETPPAEAWDELEGMLDTLKPRVPATPYRRLLHVTMVALILLLSFPLIKRLTNTATSNQPLAQNTTQSQTNTASNSAANTDKTAGTAPVEKADPTATAASNTENNTQANTEHTNNNGQASTNVTAGSTITAAKAPGTGAKAKIAKASTNNNKHAATGTAHKNTNVKTGKTIVGKNGTLSGPNAEDEQTDNVYNSSTMGNTAKDKKTLADANQSAALTTPVKKTTTPDKKTLAAVKEQEKAANKNRFRRLEAGVKVGYERSYSDAMASKMTISPYVQFNISPKVSIMTQPTVKYANLPKKTIATNSYYQKNDDGMIGMNSDPVPYTVTHGGSTSIDHWTTNYSASESHDSIVKSYIYGGSYMEFELPILLKYKLSKHLSGYAGVGLVYSQMTNITEHTYRLNDITKTFSGDVQTKDYPNLGVGDLITYNGTPYKNYTGALYMAPQKGVLRAGYTLGFSYEYNKQWLFDALTQISPIKPIMKGGYDINTPLSSPYLRLSIGYKLTK